MNHTILIAKRFCGPSTSGNGGYTCGLISQAMEMPADVTIRRPIPLEVELAVKENGEGVQVRSGDELIAEGAPLVWSANAPREEIDFGQAEAASVKSPAFHNHPFPSCFTCGPDRAEGDGLRIFPGKWAGEGGDYFAAPWVPHTDFADAKGYVREEIVWAAMDCPTGFAGGFASAGTLVTGKLGARLIAPVRAEEKCVLLSWATGIEGRKHFAECVLLGEDGTVRAESHATWIKLA
jgi:hypothetical protein